jgi:hypothetical protein
VHPEQPILRLAQEPVRVALPQVLFVRKGDTANVVKAGHGPGIETDLSELLAVEPGADRASETRFKQGDLKFVDAVPG